MAPAWSLAAQAQESATMGATKATTAVLPQIEVVEAELACNARPRRYVFHYDEVAEAEAQGLPYVLAPRVLSRREWMERYAKQ
jgi:hypothetical protein